METKWLEDFISLAQTRSFSRSAQLRHVTQPAFSRRIRALEAWAGTELVDRSTYPTRLTPAGQWLQEQAQELLQHLQATHSTLRALGSGTQDSVVFAVPHNLALAFFPAWWSSLDQPVAGLSCHLLALNVHDAVLRLEQEGCDLLLAYHHPWQPIELDEQRFEMLVLGDDTLAPFARADDRGKAQHLLPGHAEQPLPYLAYSPVAYLGGLVERLLRERPAALHPVYETDMAESLKAMALAGHGVAFLPVSAVRQEVQGARLAPAGPDWQLSLQIRLYRQRHPAGRAKPAVERLWRRLSAACDSA